MEQNEEIMLTDYQEKIKEIIQKIDLAMEAMETIQWKLHLELKKKLREGI